MMVLYASYVSIIVTLAVVYVLYLLVKRMMRGKRYNLPPGIRVPITNALHLHVWDHKEKFGHVSRMKILSIDMYVVNTIEAIHHVMLSPELINHTDGRKDSKLSKFLLKDGLVMCNDTEKYPKLRALAFMSFKPLTSQAIEEVMITELAMLREELRKVEGQTIDIQDYINPSLSNIMFITMIGKRFDYGHKIHQSMKCLLEQFLNMTDIKAKIALSLFPFLRHLPFGYGAMCKSWYRAMEDIMKYILYDIRKEGREAWKDHHGLVYDLLKQQEQHDWLSDEEVYGVIRDMFLAGIMTTRSSLYSLFLFLIHLPDVQVKLHQELDELGHDPCLDNLDRLPYTHAIILETLRLDTVTPLGVGRVATQDIQLYGYDIPKGSIIVPNLWKVHHDESLWTDPWKFIPDRFIDQQDVNGKSVNGIGSAIAIIVPNLWKVHHDESLWTDPWKFIPDRFIDEQDGTLLPTDDPIRRNLIPFGLGKRRCIGDTFAKARMFLLVSHLWQAFHFYSDDPHNLPSMDPKTFNQTALNRPQNYKLKVEVRR